MTLFLISEVKEKLKIYVKQFVKPGNFKSMLTILHKLFIKITAIFCQYLVLVKLFVRSEFNPQKIDLPICP